MPRILICFILLACWAPPKGVFAQEELSIIDEAVDDNVMDGPPRLATPLMDSLKLRTLELDIELAEAEVTRSNFLHRLIPEIHLSGSIGFKDMLFYDPSYNVLSAFPRDAYRLNLSLSLSGLIDNSAHRMAESKLERLRLESNRLRYQLQEYQSNALRQLRSLQAVAELDSTELSMKEDVLRFNDLRFEHGKIEYDVLMRSKLDVLSVKKSIRQLNQRIDALHVILYGEILK